MTNGTPNPSSQGKKQKFKIGDRAKIQSGWSHRPDIVGTVVSVMGKSLVRFKSDRAKTPSTIHVDFLVKIP